MFFEESTESSSHLIVISKRPSRFLEDVVLEHKDLIISSEKDFSLATNLAHAYVERFTHDQKTLDTFVKLGDVISQDFQFLNQGGGIDTLAGQIANNVVDNRDCKLPTFLLALAYKELNPESAVEIVSLKSSPAHPYVRVIIDGKVSFGHFVLPNLDIEIKNTEFELLNEEKTKELENFVTRDRANRFSVGAKGMEEIDKQFLKV